MLKKCKGRRRRIQKAGKESELTHGLRRKMTENVMKTSVYKVYIIGSGNVQNKFKKSVDKTEVFCYTITCRRESGAAILENDIVKETDKKEQSDF